MIHLTTIAICNEYFTKKTLEYTKHLEFFIFSLLNCAYLNHNSLFNPFLSSRHLYGLSVIIHVPWKGYGPRSRHALWWGCHLNATKRPKKSSKTRQEIDWQLKWSQNSKTGTPPWKLHNAERWIVQRVVQHTVFGKTFVT